MNKYGIVLHKYDGLHRPDFSIGGGIMLKEFPYQ